jgi:hypothetical protein
MTGFLLSLCSEKSAGAYIEIEGKKIALGIPNVSNRDMASRVLSLFSFFISFEFIFNLVFFVFVIVCCTCDESSTSAVSERFQLFSSIDEMT